jgi:hypothetical protein
MHQASPHAAASLAGSCMNKEVHRRRNLRPGLQCRPPAVSLPRPDSAPKQLGAVSFQRQLPFSLPRTLTRCGAVPKQLVKISPSGSITLKRETSTDLPAPFLACLSRTTIAIHQPSRRSHFPHPLALVTAALPDQFLSLQAFTAHQVGPDSRLLRRNIRQVPAGMRRHRCMILRLFSAMQAMWAMTLHNA